MDPVGGGHPLKGLSGSCLTIYLDRRKKIVASPQKAALLGKPQRSFRINVPKCDQGSRRIVSHDMHARCGVNNNIDALQGD